MSKLNFRKVPLGDLYRYLREYLLFLRPAVVTEKGFKFIGIQKMMNSSFELDVCALIEQQSESGTRTFIDVGAHQGYFSVLAATRKMNVIAIEPDPINYKILKRNIRINKLDNVRTFNIGLGDKAATLTFYGFSTGVSTEPDWAGNVSKRNFKVIVEKLDDILDFHEVVRYPTILKIDVEGFEENVIKGAENFIKTAQSLLLIIEITFTKNQKVDEISRSQAAELVKKLVSWNYFPMEISKNGLLIKLEDHILTSLVKGEVQGISGNFAFQRMN